MPNEKLIVSVQPFPMPEPQRAQSMRILVEVANANHIPPAMLVTHLPACKNRLYTGIRVEIWKRILAEVPGTGVRMLARAFRRDPARIRELLHHG
jgi:hypothetical protein